MARRLPPVLNRALGAVFGRLRVRIRRGPNRGLWWTVASSGRGYLSGSFEAERVNAVVALLREGETVWDVGAHKGYLTLAAARAVGSGGRIFSFEPSAVNRAFLERHVAWNGFANVTVLPFALFDRDGEVAFGGAGSSLTYRVGGGEHNVAARSIASLIEDDGLPPPDVLKIDAERAEAAILRGAGGHLDRSLVWLSLHGRDLYAECREILAARGFQLWEAATLARRTSDPGLAWGADQELLAVGPHRELVEREVQDLDLFR